MVLLSALASLILIYDVVVGAIYNMSAFIDQHLMALSKVLGFSRVV